MMYHIHEPRFTPGKAVKRHERIRAMQILWKTYPKAKIGWCSSHFVGDYLCLGAIYSLEARDNPYIWLDKSFNS